MGPDEDRGRRDSYPTVSAGPLGRGEELGRRATCIMACPGGLVGIYEGGPLGTLGGPMGTISLHLVPMATGINIQGRVKVSRDIWGGATLSRDMQGRATVHRDMQGRAAVHRNMQGRAAVSRDIWGRVTVSRDMWGRVTVTPLRINPLKRVTVNSPRRNPVRRIRQVVARNPRATHVILLRLVARETSPARLLPFLQVMTMAEESPYSSRQYGSRRREIPAEGG